jgi:hypothetical protein
MNTASQDLEKHLETLKNKLNHPTDYERALAYFLEEFAGDIGFHQQGDKDDAPHLHSLLGMITSKMLQRTAQVEDFGACYLPGHGFFHGRANVDEDFLIFFYFEGINRGLVTLGGLGTQKQLIARWQLPDGLPRNPRNN